MRPDRDGGDGGRTAAAVGVTLVVAVALAVAAGGAFTGDAGPPGDPRGIDVSHHQGEIDWREVATEGIEFAFIKATEGGDHRDSLFERNWSDSFEAGIVRGAYHFFTFCTPGRPQARNFVEAVAADSRSLPPAVDVEFSGNCTTWDRDGDIADVRRSLREFLLEVERATGDRPILYVTDESYRRIVRGHFDEWPLWVRSLFGRPAVAPASGWLVWQYADRGRLAGIDGVVDLNLYAGTRGDLLDAAGRGRDAVGEVDVRGRRLAVGPLTLGMTIDEARAAIGALEPTPVAEDAGCSGLEGATTIAGHEATVLFVARGDAPPRLGVIRIRQPLHVPAARVRLRDAVPSLGYRPSRHDPGLAETDNPKPLYALPGAATDAVMLDPSGILWVTRLDCLD